MMHAADSQREPTAKRTGADGVSLQAACIGVSPGTPQIGATAEYTLRVSTCLVARARFTDPQSAREYVLMERKAVARRQGDGRVKVNVRVNPLGGACLLKKPAVFWAVTGGFNYDCADSKKISDFRVQIRERDWEQVKKFCQAHFANPSAGVIETDINREIGEELEEALGHKVPCSAWRKNGSLGIAVQEDIALSERAGSAGCPTRRIFNVQDVEIVSPELIREIMEQGIRITNEALADRAVKRACEAADGNGRATALTLLRLSEMRARCAAARARGERVAELDAVLIG